MKAAFIEQTGPPEAIRYGELDKPGVSGSGVLVRVRAVAVNPIDTYVRSGLIAASLPKPFILGCDLAGEVEEVGPEVRHFKVGDRVWGSNQGLMGRQGTFAEYAAVDEAWLYPTPPGVGDELAAATALAGITAHLGLLRRARLFSGETILVNGGSGGVGTMVIQIAKVLGARIIATAGSEEKRAWCLECGADRAIDYRDPDFVKIVRAFAPHGVDVWWETPREPDFERAVPLLGLHGRCIIMAGREARPVFPVGPFYVKCCSLLGFAMFNYPPHEQAVCATDLNRWMQEGRIRPRIDRVLPLSEAAQAHRLQEENTLHKAGTAFGKFVLRT